MDQQIAARVEHLGRGSKKLLIDGEWVEATRTPKWAYSSRMSSSSE
jgi:hypothetical protein